MGLLEIGNLELEIQKFLEAGHIEDRGDHHGAAGYGPEGMGGPG